MDIKNKILDVIKDINDLQDCNDKIDIINFCKQELHKISPFKDDPADCVIWVKSNKISANDYNPNKVANPEYELLEHSIENDGYTQPIVTFKNGDGWEVIDGFHRNLVGRKNKSVCKRIMGYLPITVINETRIDKKDRMASTIRHNRARGTHGIKPMSEIVAELHFTGWSDKKIAKELGMDKDEVLRLKQFTGLGMLFKNRDFSKAWINNE